MQQQQLQTQTQTQLLTPNAAKTTLTAEELKEKISTALRDKVTAAIQQQQLQQTQTQPPGNFVHPGDFQVVGMPPSSVAHSQPLASVQVVPQQQRSSSVKEMAALFQALIDKREAEKLQLSRRKPT